MEDNLITGIPQEDYYKPSWDETFFSIAHVMSNRSPDLSTKTACVIVRDNRILATGYNGLPRGFDFESSDPRNQRPTKYLYYVHAEENAILNAAKEGVSLIGSTLYVLGIPCSSCCRSIIQSGIKIVKIHDDFENMKFKWPVEEKQATMDMFEKCGVEVIFLPIKLKPIYNLTSGVLGEVFEE